MTESSQIRSPGTFQVSLADRVERVQPVTRKLDEFSFKKDHTNLPEESTGQSWTKPDFYQRSSRHQDVNAFDILGPAFKRPADRHQASITDPRQHQSSSTNPSKQANGTVQANRNPQTITEHHCPEHCRLPDPLVMPSLPRVVESEDRRANYIDYRHYPPYEFNPGSHQGVAEDITRRAEEAFNPPNLPPGFVSTDGHPLGSTDRGHGYTGIESRDSPLAWYRGSYAKPSHSTLDKYSEFLSAEARLRRPRHVPVLNDHRSYYGPTLGSLKQNLACHPSLIDQADYKTCHHKLYEDSVDYRVSKNEDFSRTSRYPFTSAYLNRSASDIACRSVATNPGTTDRFTKAAATRPITGAQLPSLNAPFTDILLVTWQGLGKGLALVLVMPANMTDLFEKGETIA